MVTFLIFEMDMPMWRATFTKAQEDMNVIVAIKYLEPMYDIARAMDSGRGHLHNALVSSFGQLQC